jgi:hypothetical protein
MWLAALSLPVFNGSTIVNKLLYPDATREWLGDYMAPQTNDSEYIWEKGYGRGGSNKIKHRRSEINVDNLRYWEDHVDGPEYRVITVNDKIVQQFARFGDLRDRTYTWIPRERLPERLRKRVRNSTRRLTNEIAPHSAIAWDVIWNPEVQRAFILEGNTSPGMNRFTAARIANGIRALLQEERSNASN